MAREEKGIDGMHGGRGFGAKEGFIYNTFFVWRGTGREKKSLREREQQRRVNKNERFFKWRKWWGALFCNSVTLICFCFVKGVKAGNIRGIG